jgi:hypothetical protein
MNRSRSFWLGVIALMGYAPAGFASLTPTQIEAQPNLMILLSNSASMSKNMPGTADANGPGNVPLQSACPANYNSASDYVAVPTFNDGGTGACAIPSGQTFGYPGTFFPYGSYGNQADSRFYIAKQALYNILTSNYAKNINLGFATYRQAFGLMAASVTQVSNAIYPNIFLPGQSGEDPSTFPAPYDNYTPTQLANVAQNPLNFSFVSWYPVYNSAYSGPSLYGNALLGNGLDGPSGFNSSGLFADIPNSFLTNSKKGGLPYTVSFPSGTLQNYTVPSGSYDGSYYGGGGLTPAQAKEVPQPAEPALTLCNTAYNSQSNTFYGIYAAENGNGSPYTFQQSFPSYYNANTLYYVTLGSPLFNSNGYISNGSYEQSCNVQYTPSGSAAPSQMTIAQGEQMLSNQLIPAGGGPAQNAYFSYIPNWNSGTASPLNLNPGSADGWSGQTSVNSSGTISASYPSTPQSESILGKWNWAGAKWMGVFVNLPSQVQGQVSNNAPIIASLVNPANSMENQSGLEYSYNKQSIENSSGQPRSIANSSMSASYDGHQEPLYDSLQDAYAYWQAFEKTTQGGYGESCYHNNMLVIFDGISDGHSGYTQQQEQNALLKIASALYKNLGVKIYVIIISQNPGDITQANALANAGGTGQAFEVGGANGASELASALQSTFISVANESVLSSFSAPPTIQSGDYEFAPITVSQAGGQGDLEAYQVLSSGGLNSTTSLTPTWDSEALMESAGGMSVSTTQISGSGAFQSGPEEPLTALASNSPSVFDPPSGLSASTIASYTDDPNIDGGEYLGGRTSGWYVGLPSGSQPVVVTPPASSNFPGSSTYQNFVVSHENRATAVLYTGQDGLLTAIKYDNGSSPSPSVLWSWMPSGLIPLLQNYNTFWTGNAMTGGFAEQDALHRSAWHSYVVGSAQNGQILYDLQLSGTNAPNLGNTTAEFDLGADYTQVASGSPALYAGSSGVSYAAWSLSDTSSSGTSSTGIFVLNIGTGAGEFLLSPNGTTALTSMPIFGESGNLYVGAGDEVLEITASQLQSLMKRASASASWPTISAKSTSWSTLSSQSGATNLMPFPSGVNNQIQWLQESYSQGSYWLTAESSQGISAIQQQNGSWSVQWYSSTGGAGRNSAGNLVPQPANSNASNAIPVLPASASVTDAALVASGAVYLPVSVPPSGDACGITTADYYLFRLTDGAFPSGLLTSVSGTPVTNFLNVGYGKSLTPSLAFMNGRPIIQSASSNTNSSETFPATTTTGLPPGGPHAWRLVLTY